MKLEITLCYSVLEYCLRNFDPWDPDQEANKLREELMRRLLVMHPDLQETWEMHFKENCPDLINDFMLFISNTLLYEKRCKHIDGYEISENLEQLFGDDEIDKRLLYNICNATEDKILFSELMDDICESPLCEVDIYNIQRIVDDSEDHDLNKYRLPIANRPIRSGDCSVSLSDHLRKYIYKEQELVICDNHIWTSRNSTNLYHYLLNHVPGGAQIKNFTTDQVSNISDTQIINRFSQPHFQAWNLEIFLVNDKKENHARKIITSKYVINLEKGLASFGTGLPDKTDETLLNISYKTEPIQLPRGRQIL